MFGNWLTSRIAMPAMALLLLLGGTYARAVPIIITWEGTFSSGVFFDGIDVSGQSWVVRQVGDTTFADTFPSPNEGQFFGFTTVMDLPGIGEFNLVADYGSGLQQGFDYISLLDQAANACFLCGFPNAPLPLGFDPNVLGNVGPIDLSGTTGAYFGYTSLQPNAPLSSFNGGRSFDANYPANALLSVVSITSPVPAPGSLALLGLGLAGLGWQLRRR